MDTHTEEVAMDMDMDINTAAMVAMEAMDIHTAALVAMADMDMATPADMDIHMEEAMESMTLAVIDTWEQVLPVQEELRETEITIHSIYGTGKQHNFMLNIFSTW